MDQSALRCSTEGEAGTSGCSSTLVDSGQMGPEYLALTPTLVWSVGPAGQQCSGSSQLLKAAASAGPLVLKWEAVGGLRNAGVFKSCAPFSLKAGFGIVNLC